VIRTARVVWRDQEVRGTMRVPPVARHWEARVGGWARGGRMFFVSFRDRCSARRVIASLGSDRFMMLARGITGA
jgi:hypothetical protein